MECSNILIAFHYKSGNMNSIKGILFYIILKSHIMVIHLYILWNQIWNF